MLDPLTAVEIQALRLRLQLFASRQTDATIRSQCHAVDTRLAEVLKEDDPILRQILANSVEQLKEPCDAQRLRRLQCTFLQGFAVRDTPPVKFLKRDRPALLLRG